MGIDLLPSIPAEHQLETPVPSPQCDSHLRHMDRQIALHTIAKPAGMLGNREKYDVRKLERSASEKLHRGTGASNKRQLRAVHDRASEFGGKRTFAALRTDDRCAQKGDISPLVSFLGRRHSGSPRRSTPPSPVEPWSAYRKRPVWMATA